MQMSVSLAVAARIRGEVDTKDIVLMGSVTICLLVLPAGPNRKKIRNWASAIGKKVAVGETCPC